MNQYQQVRCFISLIAFIFFYLSTIVCNLLFLSQNLIYSQNQVIYLLPFLQVLFYHILASFRQIISKQLHITAFSQQTTFIIIYHLIQSRFLFQLIFHLFLIIRFHHQFYYFQLFVIFLQFEYYFQILLFSIQMETFEVTELS